MRVTTEGEIKDKIIMIHEDQRKWGSNTKMAPEEKFKEEKMTVSPCVKLDMKMTECA